MSDWDESYAVISDITVYEDVSVKKRPIGFIWADTQKDKLIIVDESYSNRRDY